MRALLCKEFKGLGSLVLEESSDLLGDPTPGLGEVLIDVKAAGVNFPDLLMVAGKYQFKPELPFVPGGECSGVVKAVGEGVKHVKPGDSVIAMDQTGAFAEQIKVKATAVIPLPPGVSFEVGAGVAITYGTSYYALKQKARLQEGETLLVLGAGGGVGMATVELGKVMGARVIAAASQEAKLDAACAAGADLRINYTAEPLKQRIKELTEGKGADVVYDPVGGDFSEQAFRATAWNGRFLVIGFAAGEIPKIPLNLALLKGADICGVFWGSWTQRDPKGSMENFTELSRMLAGGTLKPRISTYKLEDYAEALTTLAERRAVGKVVLTMD